jgi:hypothetical protein
MLPPPPLNRAPAGVEHGPVVFILLKTVLPQRPTPSVKAGVAEESFAGIGRSARPTAAISAAMDGQDANCDGAASSGLPLSWRGSGSCVANCVLCTLCAAPAACPDAPSVVPIAWTRASVACMVRCAPSVCAQRLVLAGPRMQVRCTTARPHRPRSAACEHAWAAARVLWRCRSHSLCHS